MKYPAVERSNFSEITTPVFGVVIDDKGAQQPMSGIRLATHLRERERASPRLLMRALNAPESITALGDQTVGRPLVAGGLDQDPGRKLYGPVRPHHASAGGGPHP